MDRKALDDALLAAHTSGDTPALVRLYSQAADRAEATGDIDAACFYLTHAYVFALHAGVAEAHDINARLVEHGREEPLSESLL